MSDTPKATILKPTAEYADYKKFCEDSNLKIISEVEFYKAAFYLALRGLVTGLNEENGIASFELGDTSLILFAI